VEDKHHSFFLIIIIIVNHRDAGDHETDVMTGGEMLQMSKNPGRPFERTLFKKNQLSAKLIRFSLY
jgi:hypothetical protein